MGRGRTRGCGLGDPQRAHEGSPRLANTAVGPHSGSPRRYRRAGYHERHRVTVAQRLDSTEDETGRAGSGSLKIDAVPYGFWSSFQDWAAECTDAPREVCDFALTHVNTQHAEASYRRTDLFDFRRLMADWEAYVA